jgi:GTPase
MVLVDGTRIFPRAYWEFDAEIWLFECEKSAKNISASYEPVINFQTSRQICKIIKDFKESLVKLTLAKQKSKSIDNKV